MEDPTSEYVWLDISSPDEPLPFYQDSIMAKVLRTNEAITLKRKTLLRRKNVESLAGNLVNGGAAVFSRAPDAPAAVSAAPTRKSEARPISGNPKPYSDEPSFSNPPSVSAKQATAQKPVVAPKPTPAPKPAAPAVAPAPVPAAVPAAPTPPVKDMLSDDFESSVSVSSKAAAKPVPVTVATEEDILDFGEGPASSSAPSKSLPGSQKVSSSNLNSFQDMDGAPTLSRAELKANKDDQINSQVQKALEEKQEVRYIHLNCKNFILSNCHTPQVTVFKSLH